MTQAAPDVHARSPVVLLDDSYGWTSTEIGDVWLHTSPGMRHSESLLWLLTHQGSRGMTELRDWASSVRPGFAAVVETPHVVFATVDKVGSVPLFYSTRGGRLHVSNSARLIRNRLGLDIPDEAAMVEFRMTGYTTGGTTLCEGLRQLQAGECLSWDWDGEDVCRERYFLYRPDDTRVGSADRLLQDLAERTDVIFRRIVEEADGRPIWVPLSGGLDSRLVLCKLTEHAAADLHAFSYGPRGNDQAAAARQVAERLDVPWFEVHLTGDEIRRSFASVARRRYWERADGLSVVPSMAEFPVFTRLLEQGTLPQDALIVNGQSGDFITAYRDLSLISCFLR